MNPNNLSASDDPLQPSQLFGMYRASEQEIVRLKAELKNLENIERKQRYDWRDKRESYEDEIASLNHTNKQIWNAKESAEHEVQELQRKLNELEKQISGAYPTCKSVQSDILHQFPNLLLVDKCPVCDCCNVDCKIGAHPPNAEILLQKLKSSNKKRKYDSVETSVSSISWGGAGEG